MSALVRLAPRSGAVYQQIVEQIKRMVALGALTPGQQLPTAKELAGQLTVNLNTVAHAYKELERDGVVELIAGKGTFVRAAGRGAARKAGAKAIGTSLSAIVNEARAIDLSAVELRDLFERALSAGYRSARQSAAGAR